MNAEANVQGRRLVWLLAGLAYFSGLWSALLVAGNRWSAQLVAFGAELPVLTQMAMSGYRWPLLPVLGLGFVVLAWVQSRRVRLSRTTGFWLAVFMAGAYALWCGLMAFGLWLPLFKLSAVL
jgi:hypothetical protein